MNVITERNGLQQYTELLLMCEQCTTIFFKYANEGMGVIPGSYCIVVYSKIEPQVLKCLQHHIHYLTALFVNNLYTLIQYITGYT